MGKIYVIGAIHDIKPVNDGFGFTIDRITEDDGCTNPTLCVCDKAIWEAVDGGGVAEDENCCAAGTFNSDKTLVVSKIMPLRTEKTA